MRGFVSSGLALALLSACAPKPALKVVLVPPIERPAPEASPATAPEPERITTPSGLAYQDLRVGHGPAPEPGQSVAVRYSGWFEDGSPLPASGDEPIVFPLGLGRVIRGWEEGVASLRVGGRRRLIIPPDLAYGDKGVPGAIPPESTLIFEIELLSVEP